MKTLKEVLATHGEAYDIDCQLHGGCVCGTPHPFADDPIYCYDDIADWWAGHVADIIMEWMAEAGYNFAPTAD